MRRLAGLTAAVLLLLGLCACGGGSGGAAESGLPAESAAPAPTVSAGPAETAEPSPDPTVKPNYISDFGWSVVVPQGQVEILKWDGGVTIRPLADPDCYLSVSLLDAESVNVAMAALRYENGVEGDATGVMFGAQGYAGAKLTQRVDAVDQQYILYQHRERVYLVETAVLDGTGADVAGLLWDMLDTITFD